MLVTLHRRFDLLAEPRPPAVRDRQRSAFRRVGSLPEPRGTAPLSSILRGILFPAVRECLEVSRTDRDLKSLATHERTRAALRRVQIAAVHGSGPSLGGVAAHKAARGSS